MFIEAMEHRTLLSVVQNGGRLDVTGTPGDDHIELLRRDQALIVRFNGESHRFDAVTIGRVEVKAGAGDDVIDARHLSSSRDTFWVDLFGEAGDDRMHGPSGFSVVAGGDGNDRLVATGDLGYYKGGPGDDLLIGSEGSNHLEGGDGADRLFGMGGDDNLLTGNEAAKRADHAPDHADGGDGTDRIVFDDAIDTLTNGEDVDRHINPFNPSEQNIKLGWPANRMGAQTRVAISITFGNSGPFFRIGQVTRDGNVVRVEVLSYGRATGVYTAALTTKTRIVSLGELEDGSYTLELIGHAGQVLKTRTFQPEFEAINPRPDDVHLNVNPDHPSGHTKLGVAVRFPTSGPLFKLGDTSRDGNTIRQEVLAFSRPKAGVFPAFFTRTRRTTLGELEPGNYRLELIGHDGVMLKTRTFIVD